MEDLKQTKEKKIEEFMNNWFKHFDHLDENKFFLQYLSNDVKMKFPGNDLFIGHEAFCDWFTDSKNNMLGNTTHDISNIKIKVIGRDQFDVNFKVPYIANMKQANIDLEVIEDWKLFWDSKNEKPVISEYLVSLS